MNQHTSSPTPVDQMVEKAVLDLGIPPCPAILDRFMVEARKDEPDYHRLASIICSDVSLSASLIKTANSPYFGARQRVRSVNEALVILGLNTASRAVAGIILRKSFPTVPNMERFWDASSRFARLSGWLAQQLDTLALPPEDAYTFGLFRDCGIPVLLRRLPSYESVLQSANKEVELDFTQVEDAVLPTNHAMVGCVLAQSWWLPEELCLAIRHHHNHGVLATTTSPPPLLSRKLIATTQLAEHLVQQQLGLSLTQEWGKLGETCLNLLDLDEERLGALAVEAAPIISANE
ncbi:MAG: HDOD domain-containing protein [Sideroxydans sp.]|nr:HDOD domain-containing protein [Sideroxydans sp.]